MHERTASRSQPILELLGGFARRGDREQGALIRRITLTGIQRGKRLPVDDGGTELWLETSDLSFNDRREQVVLRRRQLQDVVHDPESARRDRDSCVRDASGGKHVGEMIGGFRGGGQRGWRGDRPPDLDGAGAAMALDREDALRAHIRTDEGVPTAQVHRLTPMLL
jgi:hypothetical protein